MSHLRLSPARARLVERVIEHILSVEPNCPISLFGLEVQLAQRGYSLPAVTLMLCLNRMVEAGRVIRIGDEPIFALPLFSRTAARECPLAEASALPPAPSLANTPDGQPRDLLQMPPGLAVHARNGIGKALHAVFPEGLDVIAIQLRLEHQGCRVMALALTQLLDRMVDQHCLIRVVEGEMLPTYRLCHLAQDVLSPPKIAGPAAPDPRSVLVQNLLRPVSLEEQLQIPEPPQPMRAVAGPAAMQISLREVGRRVLRVGALGGSCAAGFALGVVTGVWL